MARNLFAARSLPALLLVGVLGGCATAPAVIVSEGGQPTRTGLDTWLQRNPLLAEQNIKAARIGQTAALSTHIVQIRDREQPHIHASHDLSVTLLRGEGLLYIERTPHPMRRGDVAVVPHGTPHYFVNFGTSPAVAFVTFAPPSDGSDNVPTPE